MTPPLVEWYSVDALCDVVEVKPQGQIHIELTSTILEEVIDDEASWLKYVEELNKTKSTWLVNSATADALVARDRAGLGVCDTLAYILSDWLDTLGLNDVDCVDDGTILWMRVDVIMWGAIDDEASWPKYVVELDETKSPWLVNSATADALVARDRVGLGVSDTLADIFLDWLDTFDSAADGDILWVKFVMIFSDAGKDENKN